MFVCFTFPADEGQIRPTCPAGWLHCLEVALSLLGAFHMIISLLKSSELVTRKAINNEVV